MPCLPSDRYTALPIQRYLKTGATAYTEIADAFASRKPAALRAALAKHAAVLERDRNGGMAKQTTAALVRRNVLRLTQTYLTLSLAV